MAPWWPCAAGCTAGAGFWSEHPGRPVIVVGNVIAGGASKTPWSSHSSNTLQARGLRPGVISRGYGRSAQDCRAVQPDSPASEVGDEPPV